ncbi:MAG: T9SS type A sorting domain-containing protein [bacterium]|nr:MAG: T9SS type A sorting domain-containing protein [bacterium]
MPKYYISFLLLLLYAPVIFAESKLVRKPAADFPAKTTQTLLNINNWSGWIYWDGRSGNNPLGNSGVIYPRSTAGVVFLDGFIWGGIINDGTTPTLRVGGQNYLIGTQPGRILSQGVAQNPGDPEVQIYRIRSDYLTVSDEELRQDAAELNLIDPSQVTQTMIDSVRAQYTRAWNQWPGDLGAPYYDQNGNGLWDLGIDEPGLLNAHQVIWFVCNDLDSSLSTMLYGSPPLGIELQVTMWGYKGHTGIAQAAFRRYRFINKSGYPIDSMYVSQFSDTDIGVYSNDLVGCDSLLGLSFGYNGEPSDPEFNIFGIAPPAIGYTLLQGPAVPSPGDTALFNFQKKSDFRNLPLTSFGYFSAGNPEWDDPDFSSYNGTLQWFNLLRGFIPTDDVLNPIPFTHRNTGAVTKYPLNGDPLNGIGDVDGTGNNFPPADRRIALCTGPFSVMDGDTQEVVWGIVGGSGSDYLNSVTEMKNVVEEIRSHYGSTVLFPSGLVSVDYPDNQHASISCLMYLESFNSVNSCEAIFNPQQGSEPPFSLILFDDGQHGDSLAGDNIWGNQATLTNRKYPYRADVTINWMSSHQIFPSLFKDIRLRPEPQLINWQITWENGLQDDQLNNSETVHYRFMVQNIDQINSIEQFTIEYAGDILTYGSTIPAGATVNSDSFLLVVNGPSGGDSLTVNYTINFDVFRVPQSVTFPVVPWTPPFIWGDTLWVQSLVGLKENIFPVVADPLLLNGHEYHLTFFEDTLTTQLRWQLYDVTSSELKVIDGIPSNDPNYSHPVVDGIIFIVRESEPAGFRSFQVVANAAGPIDPPEMGCFAFNNNGFPFLYNARYPNGTDRPTPGVQQSTNMSVWGVHTGMTPLNDGNYTYFLERVARNDNWHRILPYSFEMRFTSHGGIGSWAYENQGSYLVPFELWNIGIDTPDDPSDDYRMIPWILNDTGPGAPLDSVYNINPNDHAVSGGTNDPYMDWVYWQNPENTAPGIGGYIQYLSQALHGTYNFNSPEVMAHTVLVNLNAGDVNDPTFPANLNAEIPEVGTIFRIIPNKPNLPGDTLQIIAPLTSLTPVTQPFTYQLWQNYPNPFNPTTTITFSLQKAGKVQLEIFNVLGQKVRTLLNQWMPPGKHTRIWSATNDAGQFLGSGIYFYRIASEDFVKTRKMILLK